MAKAVNMFYGESGTGKSDAIAAIARKFAERGKRTRLIIGDGSRATYDDLIDAGLAEVIDYTIRDYPLSTMQLLTEGYWPADPEDPTSKLLPPTPQSMKDIGLVAVEGLSVGSNYVMGDNIGGLSWRSGKGEKIGQDSPIRVGDGTYVKQGHVEIFKPAFEGAKEFGANPPSHYNVTQRRMLTYVDRSKVLPVDMVIWTAHQRAVEEKLSKEIIVGPEVAGAALTANLQRIFNHTLHFAVAGKRISGGKDEHTEKRVDELDLEYRIYTRDHFSPDGNVTYKFKAVTRAVPPGTGKKDKNGNYDGMPLYLVGEHVGDNILEFFEIVHQFVRRKAEATKAAFEKAQTAA